jgi:hypothetical protein
MAIEGDGNVVSSAAEILGVEGLVDVADEVHDELEGFVAGPESGVWVQDDRCLFVSVVSFV